MFSKTSRIQTRSRKPWGQIVLILLFPAVMVPLGMVDQNWTNFLNQHQQEFFGEFMARTMFSEGKLGGSDLAIIMELVFFGLYFRYPWNRKYPSLRNLRPFLGYSVFCSFFTGLGLVHSFKWVMGRARPFLVNGDSFPFSAWYQFGPQFVTDGIFYGSFPSGHTATVFLLMTCSYWLICQPGRSISTAVIGWTWGIFVLIYSGLMIIARSMTYDHWLTDSVGILLLSWIFIHLIFFTLLKIPAQVRYVQKNGRYAPLPKFWELSLLWRLFFIAIGIMSILIGSRALFIQRSTWLAVIILPGIFSAFYFSRSLGRIYAKMMKPFRLYITP